MIRRSILKSIIAAIAAPREFLSMAMKPAPLPPLAVELPDAVGIHFGDYVREIPEGTQNTRMRTHGKLQISIDSGATWHDVDSVEVTWMLSKWTDE